MIGIDDATAIERAYRRLHRASERDGGAGPSWLHHLRVEAIKGRRFVVWVEAGMVIAVFRIRPNNSLRQLRRFPAAITRP